MKQKNKKNKFVALITIMLGVIVLYFIYISSFIGAVAQAISAIIVLFVAGLVIQRSLDMKWAIRSIIILLGGQTGISFIEKLAKNKSEFWEQLAMWGLTIGFGLATYPLVKGRIKKGTYIFGLLSLLVISLFVTPYLIYGAQFLKNIPNLSLGSVPSTPIPIRATLSQPFQLVLIAITFFFGFSGYVIFSLAIDPALLIYSLSLFLANPSSNTGSQIASNITPGLVPVIPGITAPLLAGIFAFALVLIVHEFAHGVLARRAKIKLKSVGLLLFGFLPVGGFVEVDEQKIAKLKPELQTNILSAGIATNFVTMLVFFVLTFLFIIYIMPNAYQYGVFITSTTQGYPANGIVPLGAQVLSWNGKNITTIATLQQAALTDKPNIPVVLITDKGSYSITAIVDPNNSSRGLIGVNLGYKPLLNTFYAQLIYFLFTFISFSMLLNLAVAAVNLLPIPGFDGWRIYKANIKSKRFVNTFAALIIILFALNVVPWIFHI